MRVDHMQTLQRITILGSTGSIGTSTLDVLARHPQQFAVYALTASTQVDLMLAQCAQFKPEVAVMVQEDAARLLADKLKAEGAQFAQIFGWERPRWYDRSGAGEKYSFRRSNWWNAVKAEALAVRERVAASVCMSRGTGWLT